MKAKVLISSLLLLVLVSTSALAVTPPSGAVGQQQFAAQLLYDLTLFRGKSTNADGTPNFALEDGMTREEAITMLVRLLGKEAEALAGSYTIPFTDVSDWATPYVGYAYTTGLTNGISETSFGGKNPVTAEVYLTFQLRALGYSSASDFSWQSPWTLSDELRITRGEYSTPGELITRGEVCVISNQSLYVELAGSEVTLLASLKAAGALSESDVVIFSPNVSLTEDPALGLVQFMPTPYEGSPHTYVRFVVDHITINGIEGTVQQYETAADFAQNLPTLAAEHPDAFAYILPSFDEAAVLAASTDTGVQDGLHYPTLTFYMTGNGYLADGSTVPETISVFGYFPTRHEPIDPESLPTE